MADIIGNDNNNILIGTPDADFLVGKGGDDYLGGGDGDDGLLGGDGSDFLDGGNGNDGLNGGNGNDSLNGGNGLDFADYSTAAAGVTVNLAYGTASGGAGNDLLLNIEGVFGSSFNDTLNGRDGKDTLIGGDGNDDLNGKADEDTLYGEVGDDNLDGGDGKDSLLGGDGKDFLDGGDSSDFLAGGLGNDTLTGGYGSDTFSFSSPKEGVDTITDFSSADDTIGVLSTSNKIFGFKGGLQAGAITEQQFCLGSSAQDASNRFIYNQDTGTLCFDPDGTGSKAQTQFATLSNNASLSASDIVVFEFA